MAVNGIWTIFFHSFTHVTVTEDSIIAEEYWEDEGLSSATSESELIDVAKKLFSEDDEAVSLL